MKRFTDFRTSPLFCLLAFLTVPALATNTNPDATTTARIVTTPGALRVVVHLSKPEGHRAHLRLLDTQGEIVYLETVGKRQPDIEYALNLRELPDGPYVLEVADHHHRLVQRQSITLRTGQSGYGGQAAVTNIP